MDLVCSNGYIVLQQGTYLYTQDEKEYFLCPKRLFEQIRSKKKVKVYQVRDTSVVLTTFHYWLNTPLLEYILFDDNKSFHDYFEPESEDTESEDTESKYIPKDTHVNKLMTIPFMSEERIKELECFCNKTNDKELIDKKRKQLFNYYIPIGIMHSDMILQFYSKQHIKQVTDKLEIQKALVYGLDRNKLSRVSTEWVVKGIQPEILKWRVYSIRPDLSNTL